MLQTVRIVFFIILTTVIENGQCQITRKNVLFLVSDDMRPEITAFLGSDFPSQVHPKMHTPNLDELASKSLLLKRAYVQQAVCSPSRTSLLTGRRPDTTHVYDLNHYFRKVGGNFTTIPEFFKMNGYTSVGMGKIFHPGTASNFDDPPSWSEPYFHAPNLHLWNTRTSWQAVDRETRRSKPLPDEQTAWHAMETLRSLAEKRDKPFFLAVGFHKPHLPFVFPEEFLEFYPEEDIHVPDNPYAPVDMPKLAWSPYAELRRYSDIKALGASGEINTTLPTETVLKLRRAYYSALSYTDSLIGDVLHTLRELNLEKDTIISFWGDHGWQLGEHGEWCKITNFELATHAPMMVHIPGLTDDGIVTEHLTEYVDLFPTLVEAAGLPPLPLCPEESSKTTLCREGTSLVPLITDPSVKWKDRVFSQFPRPIMALSPEYMGYSMRTDQYRYTEWVKFSGAPDFKPLWENNNGIELYDHQDDPEENHNLAYVASNALDVLKKQLSQQLHEGWRAALPTTDDSNSREHFIDREVMETDREEELHLREEDREFEINLVKQKIVVKNEKQHKIDFL